MLGRSAFPSPGGNCWDVGLEALLLGAVCARRQFDQCVKRNLHPRALLLRHVVKVGIDTSQNSLVGDNDDVFAALELHDNWFQSNYYVTI